MAPGRRKGSGRAAAAAAAQRQWKVGDLVLAKMKGFPAWPAVISEPEKWGFSSVRKKILVYFYGTKQIAFCNYADIEAFTEEKKKSLLLKRQGKGADFVRALDEIIDAFEALKSNNVGETNARDGGNDPGIQEAECVKNNSSKSTELSSPITASSKYEVEETLTESNDVVNSDEICRMSINDDSQPKNSFFSDLTEKISIQGSLMKSPLVSNTSSRRKRSRETVQQSSFLQKRVVSSSADQPKTGHSTLLNNSLLVASESISDSCQDELVDKISNTETMHVSGFYNLLVPVNDNILSVDRSIDARVVSVAKDYEANCTDEKEMLESNMGVEASVNGHLNNKARSNGNLEFPRKTIVFKKKRKPNRKRVNNASESAKKDIEQDSLDEHIDGCLLSPNCQSELDDKSHKADGDEHLPLVKRARIRMGKSADEELQTSLFMPNSGKSEKDEMIDNCKKRFASPSVGNNCPPAETLSAVKKDMVSSPVNCFPPLSGDLMSWKTKTYEFKGFESDVEAALPPSKRLHRALEAMSANTAEDDCAKTSMVIKSDDCMESVKQSSFNHSADIVRFPSRLSAKETSESNGLERTSELTIETLDAPSSSRSEVKPVMSPSRCLSSVHGTNDSKINQDASKCSMTSIVSSHIKFEDQELCSSELVDNGVNATSSKSMSDQLLATLKKENMNEMPQYNKESPTMPLKSINGEENTNFVTKKMNIKKSSHSVPSDATFESVSGKDVASAASGISEIVKSSGYQIDEDDYYCHDLQGKTIEVKPKVTPNGMHKSSDLTPLKDLIAAAQAKRYFSRTISFPDNYSDNKIDSESIISPALAHMEDSSGRSSPSSHRIDSVPEIDEKGHIVLNSGKSPHEGLQLKRFRRSNSDVEVNAALKTFETFLSTLSRTKESIGRATRLAIDCAKYGIAGEVIDTLLQTLEREPSLHKRVDLFFLVDSITQCSRNMKGVGDVYPSLVQSVLPRLLSSAAPRGTAAWENRRQCLKVLRLWLERKTLPESIVRLHIRELDSVTELSMISGSRRPLRTERALNDPVREMEGMLVDEYGSNTSFQLPSLFPTNVLEDEEGNASDEKSFEAVTPERHIEEASPERHLDTEQENVTVQTSEKHRHVLEDIDGELEMEDVSPPHEVEVAVSVTKSQIHQQNDQPHPSHFAPPLPEDRPPSPPPLPSSPPPSVCSRSTDGVVPQQPSGKRAITDISELHFSGSNNNVQIQQSKSISMRPGIANGSFMSSETVPYYAAGHSGRPNQLPAPVTSVGPTYRNFPASHLPIHPRNSCPSLANNSLSNKAYHVQPPLPPPASISNQFSYVQVESQQRQPWRSCSSFPERFQYPNDNYRGNCYGNRGPGGTYHHDMVERGHSHRDNMDMSPVSRCHYGPSAEPPPIPCNGWPAPPRISNYSLSNTRPSMGSPNSGVPGAPFYWRPR